MIETNDIYVPTVSSSYEDTTVLKDLPPHERRHKLIQVPIALLRRCKVKIVYFGGIL